MRPKQLTLILLTLALIYALATLSHACPNCKNSLPDSDDPTYVNRLRDGYLWGYIGMTSMPFVLLSTIGTLLYRRLKQADQDQNAD